MPIFFYYLALINAITFLTYAYDKHAARKSMRRIPERTLHGLALLGGSPAALFAQQTFRHKTAKRSFQLTYWVIVVVQVAVLMYLLTSYLRSPITILRKPTDSPPRRFDEVYHRS